MSKSPKDQSGKPPGQKPNASHPGVAAGPWCVPLRRDDVPDTGLHVDLVADAPTCDAVAALADVTRLSQVKASFDLARRGPGLRVLGTVRASVTQECVVTLEPLENEIVEAVDVTFLPSIDESEASAAQTDSTIDPPEPLIDGGIDLGQLATEHLLIGIDPYPRKPDAAFDAPPVGDESGGPFAALAALKTAMPKKDPKD